MAQVERDLGGGMKENGAKNHGASETFREWGVEEATGAECDGFC
jgi:hypothetical protein